MKVPEPWGAIAGYTEQLEDWFEFDQILPHTVSDEVRRCDCMKFADSTAASMYVWLDVASASRAETLGCSQLIV